jgi:arabinofuranosyltransferase
MDKPRSQRYLALLLFVGAAVLLVLGWKLLWFLADDAFISFRYVSNSRLGFGYVWNPPPFAAVEGYTSFLWVGLLDLVWRLTGASPPAVANGISLLFSLLTLWLTSRMVLRLRLRPELAPWRTALLGLVLLGVVTHRTFLTWSSSGFETALFGFLVLAWISMALETQPGRQRAQLLLCLLAALLSLTRPEGILFVLATLALVVLWQRRDAGVLRSLAVAWPLLLVPAHFLWRRWFYGTWLPNTYHAKVVGAWPESGVRYALSFAVEYAVWFAWVVMLVVGVSQALRPARQPQLESGAGSSAVRMEWMQPALCALPLALHFLYYTFVVGGDHFEYRIYSHLVPPGFVFLVWLANRSSLRGAVVTLLLCIQVVLTWPVPWSHWALTRHLQTREETRRLRLAIAPHWPAPLRGYAQVFDELQEWLIGHWVCVRHQEHKVNRAYLTSLYPTRAEGESLPADEIPVHAFQAIGVAGWTLPRVNIIDLLGLNDYVVARSPVEAGRFRGMAHERQAPQGYADCFRPNVFLDPAGGVRIVPRREPLTATDIRECEAQWREWVARRAP